MSKSSTRALVGAAIASLLALSSLVYADPTDSWPPRYAEMMKMKPADVMHMMDKTNRGKVSKEEFAKFHEEMFNKMDKNKDGFLDPQEFGLTSP